MSRKSTRKTGNEPDVPSPCVNICRLEGPERLCRGCLRTVAEIRAWKDLGNREKRALLKRLAARRAKTAEPASGDRPPDAAPG